MVAFLLELRRPQTHVCLASNPKKDSIGSELKAMVQAPPGYKLVRRYLILFMHKA
jgi:hypothetical protein